VTVQGTSSARAERENAQDVENDARILDAEELSAIEKALYGGSKTRSPEGDCWALFGHSKALIEQVADRDYQLHLAYADRNDACAAAEKVIVDVEAVADDLMAEHGGRRGLRSAAMRDVALRLRAMTRESSR
jgi:hypothetical protein